MGDWKRWTGRQIRASCLETFEWQSEFFEHFMRSSESHSQKWEYVRRNPVRAGLVRSPEEWLYQGEMSDLTW
jgi:hypothetical protein